MSIKSDLVVGSLVYVFASAMMALGSYDMASTTAKGMDQRADELLHENCKAALTNKDNVVAAHKAHQQHIEYIKELNYEIFDGPRSGLDWKLFWEKTNGHLRTTVDDGSSYGEWPYFADHYQITVSINKDITSPRLTLNNDGSRSLLEVNPENTVEDNAEAAAELMTEALNIINFVKKDGLGDGVAMGTYSFDQDGTVIFAAQEDPKTAQVLRLPAKSAPAL